MAAAGWRRRVPSGRVVAVLVVVLVVLAGGGYAAKPLWQPWWYATQVCAGLLSTGDLADVLPAEQLKAGKEAADLAHGRMSCGVDTPDDHFALLADVDSDPDEVDRRLNGEFAIPTTPGFVFPAGIPGFQGQLGHYIVQECPDLRRDSLGRKRRLVTRVIGKWDEKHGTPATLRIAVALANGASEQAGCGAPKLPLPQRAVLRPTPVPPAKGGAGCGWLARARLPENPTGKPWRVVPRADPHAAITHCALMDGTSGFPYAEFSGWYGDWTDESFKTLVTANVSLPPDFPDGGQAMSEDFGIAAARCDGESAHYLARSAPDRRHAGRELRPLLVAFARDQAERRGCGHLALPGKRIFPSRG
ncbi:hypothetical protein ACFWJW_12185 [Streptomyces sp. NPDC127097]|uniref:hypothetical protein n=1 Tax=Streptomyces sp. NPDC127097 TaxID=3347136 RepID=UPI00365ABBFB